MCIKPSARSIIKIFIISLIFGLLTAAFSACPRAEAAPNDGSGAGGNPGHGASGKDGIVLVDRPVYDITTRKEHPPLDSMDSYVAWMLQHTTEDKNQLAARWNRAKEAIARQDLFKPDVIEAFLRTPREYFARQANWNQAYIDNFMDIGHGQTISGPHLVCKMSCELDVKPNYKVLEIGTGSGYQAAVLSQLSNYVYTIEVIKPLAETTNEIYEKQQQYYMEYLNVKRKIGDGYYGWEEYAPFDRIIVTCGIDHIPPPLLNQLKPDGIMLIPVGPPYAQHVLKVVKKVDKDGKATYEKSDIYNGRVVPFVHFTVDGQERHSVERDKPN